MLKNKRYSKSVRSVVFDDEQYIPAAQYLKSPGFIMHSH